MQSMEPSAGNLPAVRRVFAATLLGIAAERKRRLACSEDPALAEWLEDGKSVRRTSARDQADRLVARVNALGGRIVLIGQPAYPAGLLDLPDPPAFLCMLGTLAQPGGTAVVGSRAPSRAGTAMARALAGRVQAPVVAGLARGIDGAAHRGALAAYRQTVAYVGYGLGAAYPREHRELERLIAVSGGCVLSELLPGERVSRSNLVRRDRLQAAHARATVLVETELEGGAMHTLRFASALGRAVFAFEARRKDVRTVGNAHAIGDGAVPLPWDLERATRIIAGQSAMPPQ